MGISGGQRPLAGPRRTSSIALLALAVLENGWRLGGPWSVSPAISGVFALLLLWWIRVGQTHKKLLVGLGAART